MKGISKLAKVISSKVIHENKWIHIVEDEVILPGNKHAMYTVTKRAPAVVAVIKDNGKYLMVHQYRYPIDAYSLEFVKGLVNNNEPPEKAVQREAEEETGQIPRTIQYLGHLYNASGFNNQPVNIYMCSDLTAGTQKLDESESDVTTKWLSEEELKTAIKDGTIHDPLTIAAYTLAQVI